jgi:hypothetical protein
VLQVVLDGTDADPEHAGHGAVRAPCRDKLQDPGLAWGQQRLAVGLARVARQRLAQQGRDGGGLPEVRAQQFHQIPLLGAEVEALPVQRDRYHGPVRSGNAGGQLVIDPGRAVEVLVEAERPELAVADDI